MKKTITLFILLISAALFSQDFEGKIVYKNSCRSKNPDWKKEYCQMITDSSQVYYFKNGDYKYLDNNTAKWTLFKKSDNKIYTKADKIYWIDVASNEDEILDIQVNKKKLVVLGYECDELILKCKSSTQKYYFNSVTAINPKWFENHKHGNLNKIMAITKSIPLKTLFIIEDQNFELESTATEIKKGKVDDKLFELPKDVEIKEGKK